MSHKVGPKGQVVIEKEIRDRLGVQPGWQAIQILVDHHVELHFIPPEHDRSLRGAAKPFIRRCPLPGEEWDQSIAESLANDYAKKMEE